MHSTPDTSWLPQRSRRPWVAYLLLTLVPVAIVCLFLFHIVVSAGAAGGCGGG
jgi:hypothetical protein